MERTLNLLSLMGSSEKSKLSPHEKIEVCVNLQFHVHAL